MPAPANDHSRGPFTHDTRKHTRKNYGHSAINCADGRAVALIISDNSIPLSEVVGNIHLFQRAPDMFTALCELYDRSQGYLADGDRRMIAEALGMDHTPYDGDEQEDES